MCNNPNTQWISGNGAVRSEMTACTTILPQERKIENMTRETRWSVAIAVVSVVTAIVMIATTVLKVYGR